MHVRSRGQEGAGPPATNWHLFPNVNLPSTRDRGHRLRWTPSGGGNFLWTDWSTGLSRGQLLPAHGVSAAVDALEKNKLKQIKRRLLGKKRLVL